MGFGKCCLLSRAVEVGTAWPAAVLRRATVPPQPRRWPRVGEAVLGLPMGVPPGLCKRLLAGKKKIKKIREIYFEGFLVKFSMEFCNVG